MDTLVIDGLVRDLANSIANTLELLQSCIKPSKSIKVAHIFSFNSCSAGADIFREN